MERTMTIVIASLPIMLVMTVAVIVTEAIPEFVRKHREKTRIQREIRQYLRKQGER